MFSFRLGLGIMVIKFALIIPTGKKNKFVFLIIFQQQGNLLRNAKYICLVLNQISIRY